MRAVRKWLAYWTPWGGPHKDYVYDPRRGWIPGWRYSWERLFRRLFTKERP